MSTPRLGRRSRGQIVRVGLTVGAVAAAVAAPLFAVGPVRLGPAGETSAPAGPITGLAGRCVDADRSSSDNGTPVQLYDCLGNAAQSVSNPGDGTLRILGRCLDAVDFGTADGTAVQLWDCHGGPNQQWVVNGAHDIVNPAANKCLDVRNNFSANKTRLQIWTCTGAANQKWIASSGPAAQSPAEPVGDQCWATHYGPQPTGTLTSSGELYDNNADTAATSLSRPPQLPFGTMVQVTNVANGKSLVVRINDRGTFTQTPQEPKCLDLTDGAFDRLGGSLNPDDGHIVVTQQVVN
ncbi:ricin-type beta-trefoil lectin domain protein [Streptomyces sp. NPDC058470]|uniref:ricin-type beta-trefoil lectin domain protein n=1 Tax=Streptomyces sp. NPDC058470 TaxID=3346515 RepID=UPI003649D891